MNSIMSDTKPFQEANVNNWSTNAGKLPSVLDEKLQPQQQLHDTRCCSHAMTSDLTTSRIDLDGSRHVDATYCKE